MLKLLTTRLRQGHRTTRYPAEPPALPPRFRGRPVIDPTRCEGGCRSCAEACPTDAISFDGTAPRVDLGRCLFCTDCERACPGGAVVFARDHRLAARTRADLVVPGSDPLAPSCAALDEKLRALFGRSLKLRQVSAGGCNGCEADVNVLGTIAFDLGRFGIQMVASPRHADGLLVTGPVSDHMKLALEKTWAAVPAPKLVIAVGACAISGGPYAGHAETHDGCDTTVPVDLYIPGCPPHPFTILDGLLRLLGRIESGARR
ncbi:MAG: 4Fe-4S dicluster domain-containing protein [Myxococcales bacterium]|nr:4Fe-4S dicluster domain-containing protein [Myxococcales bacterium]